MYLQSIYLQNGYRGERPWHLVQCIFYTYIITNIWKLIIGVNKIISYLMFNFHNFIMIYSIYEYFYWCRPYVRKYCFKLCYYGNIYFIEGNHLKSNNVTLIESKRNTYNILIPRTFYGLSNANSNTHWMLYVNSETACIFSYITQWESK